MNKVLFCLLMTTGLSFPLLAADDNHLSEENLQLRKSVNAASQKQDTVPPASYIEQLKTIKDTGEKLNKARKIMEEQDKLLRQILIVQKETEDLIRKHLVE